MSWSPLALLVTTLANPTEQADIIEGAGFQLLMARSADEALTVVRSHVPECILLDTSVDDPSELVPAIREHTDAYILALDTLSDPSLTAALLTGGADAFLTAPYPRELLHASLRVARRHAARQRSPMQMDSRRYGDLLINFSQGRVRKGNQDVDLTSTEFRLLRALVTRHEQTVSHDELLTRVWGTDISDRTHYVRIYINRLRKKLEDDPSNPEYIVTDLGEGYRFNSRIEPD
jgi:two-component system KDP operon response regulator KdpE